MGTGNIVTRSRFWLGDFRSSPYIHYPSCTWVGKQLLWSHSAIGHLSISVLFLEYQLLSSVTVRFKERFPRFIISAQIKVLEPNLTSKGYLEILFWAIERELSCLEAFLNLFLWTKGFGGLFVLSSIVNLLVFRWDYYWFYCEHYRGDIDPLYLKSLQKFCLWDIVLEISKDLFKIVLVTIVLCSWNHWTDNLFDLSCAY